jgi:rRNA-processing protein FCF1
MWLIDGSNVLGAMRLDRASTDAKRELARLAAAFARAKRTRLTCYFDGVEPQAFARHLGNTTIVFSGSRTADELIANRAEDNASNFTVVTSDRELASRVTRRRVKVVTAQQFVKELRALESEPGEASADDWLAYFSDPKNRQDF